MNRCTARGDEPTNPEDASTPTSEKLSDGQFRDHWTMCPTEIMRAKQVRPYRDSYVHVGIAGPKYPLRDLTAEERERYPEYAKFEDYPDGAEGPAVGRFWSQADLDKVGKGCGVLTKMPHGCAETYAVNPGYYGSTFCCGCGGYFPVGKRGEFVWDGTQERVGT